MRYHFKNLNLVKFVVVPQLLSKSVHRIFDQLADIIAITLVIVIQFLSWKQSIALFNARIVRLNYAGKNIKNILY